MFGLKRVFNNRRIRETSHWIFVKNGDFSCYLVHCRIFVKVSQFSRPHIYTRHNGMRKRHALPFEKIKIYKITSQPWLINVVMTVFRWLSLILTAFSPLSKCSTNHFISFMNGNIRPQSFSFTSILPTQNCAKNKSIVKYYTLLPAVDNTSPGVILLSTHNTTFCIFMPLISFKLGIIIIIFIHLFHFERKPSFIYIFYLLIQQCTIYPFTGSKHAQLSVGYDECWCERISSAIIFLQICWRVIGLWLKNNIVFTILLYIYAKWYRKEPNRVGIFTSREQQQSERKRD